MNLVKYEILMKHVDGPEHDWWTKGENRVTDFSLVPTLKWMEDSPAFRSITVEPDPHDNHSPADLDHGMTGMYVDCTVPGCTYSKDYD